MFLSIKNQRWLLIGLGGFFGGGLRAVVEHLLQSDAPLGTLLINWTGVFVSVLLTEILVKHWSVWQQWHADFLSIGLIGAYTTYSTALLEMSQQAFVPAIIYWCLSIIGGVLIALAAQVCARWIRGAQK